MNGVIDNMNGVVDNMNGVVDDIDGVVKRKREKREEIVVAYVYRSYELSTREPYYLF